jgi:hypothetical protein
MRSKNLYDNIVVRILLIIFSLSIGTRKLINTSRISKKQKLVFGLTIVLMFFNANCQNDDKISNFDQITGFYSGQLNVGQVNGTASLNISNDGNFTFQQDLPGYGNETQSGKIVISGSSYIFKWDDGSKYTVSVQENKIVITGYNWSTLLSK